MNEGATLKIEQCNLKQAKRVDDPIIDVASDLMAHYRCGWTIAETISLQMRKIMTDLGWTLIPPNDGVSGGALNA